MRVLWIATKSPWPPRDGGRLLLLESLRAVAAHGVEVALVAPVERGERAAAEEALREVCLPRLVVTRQRSRAGAAVSSWLSGRPYSLARHDLPAVARAVARVLGEWREGGGAGGAPFDAVVAEQLQAFAQSAPAARPADLAGARPVPRILRAQNVESDLWRQLGEASRGVVRALLLRQAARLARAERAAVGTAAATIALSAADGERLRALAGPAPDSGRIDSRMQARMHAGIEVLPPPFPGRLAVAGQRLAGAPALVLFGSSGWEPNRRAELRFVNEIWPQVRTATPTATLHWFGGSAGSAGSGGSSDSRTEGAGEGVVLHRSPASSAEAFAPGAILVLPLDIASGVRMRVLEAWARGVAIVASPAAASGLDVADGRELLLAKSGPDYAQAIARLATVEGLADRLIAGGRERLAADHAPERFAAGFVALVARLAEISVERPAGGERR